MPITIERKKFVYISEWSSAFDIVENTTMNWIRDGLPHIAIGQGRTHRQYLIPKVEALAYAKREWGVVPIYQL